MSDLREGLVRAITKEIFLAPERAPSLADAALAYLARAVPGFEGRVKGTSVIINKKTLESLQAAFNVLRSM